MKKSYYENTKNNEPHDITHKFINFSLTPGKAVELGCGAGVDTVYLIKNGWKVTAIDRENTKHYITEKLSLAEQSKLTFIQDDFTNIELPPCNLLIAKYSIPFCSPDKFSFLWENIRKCIFPHGYFVGTLFGIRDEWNSLNSDKVFFERYQIYELFKGFDIILFKEWEKDAVGGDGKLKYWHVFSIIAKKRNL